MAVERSCGPRVESPASVDLVLDGHSSSRRSGGGIQRAAAVHLTLASDMRDLVAA